MRQGEHRVERQRKRRGRRDVDDRTAPLLPQERDHRVRRVDRAHEVDREEVVPRRGQLVEHQARVVDETVDSPELVNDPLSHVDHLGRVGHVGFDRDGSCTERLDVRFDVGSLVDPLQVDDRY